MVVMGMTSSHNTDNDNISNVSGYGQHVHFPHSTFYISETPFYEN